MICPKCSHEFTDPQDGREAVIAYEDAMEAYGLVADGKIGEGVKLMHTLLARPSTNDESEAT